MLLILTSVCLIAQGKRIIAASSDGGWADRQLIDEGYLGKNSVSTLMGSSDQMTVMLNHELP